MSGVPQRYVPTSPRASRSGFPSSTHVLQPYSGARAAEESTLDPKFRRRSRKFFKTGRVLEALITQPADDEDGSVKSSESSFRVAHGERVFSKTRKYVIVLEYDRHCVVLPITTYNGQGVAKHGVVKAEHGIIYTGKTIPVVSDKEHPKIGEAPMQQHAIQVTPDDRTQLLQPRSRVVYSKPYVIEENQKVKSFGMLAESDIGPLQDQFREAMRLASGIPLAWTHDRSIPGLQLGEPQPRQDLQRQVL
ncbi:hypothetical protein HII31_13149 [Pseudocercospora fuligena]|uniref:DUF6590 domain-containing protein n=1 Tax=Pseudocercospora fuligena TaxID=685502 RepID=A0A8H6VFZ1_9PEZI|nr:hypothetical protein HII31_13149 [Pseudocercospora fuligena]